MSLLDIFIVIVLDVALFLQSQDSKSLATLHLAQIANMRTTVLATLSLVAEKPRLRGKKHIFLFLSIFLLTLT